MLDGAGNQSLTWLDRGRAGGRRVDAGDTIREMSPHNSGSATRTAHWTLEMLLGSHARMAAQPTCLLLRRRALGRTPVLDVSSWLGDVAVGFS